MAALSLLTDGGGLCIARIGIAGTQAVNIAEICTQIVDHDSIVVMPDTAAEAATANGAGDLLRAGIRSFASVPLHTRGRVGIGSLCVMDRQPHQISPERIAALRAIGDSTMSMLELSDNSTRYSTSERQLRAILDLLPHAVYWMDLEGHLLGANLACLTDLGRDGFRGLTDYDACLSPDLIAQHRRCNQQVIDTGEPVVDVLEPRADGNGEQRWLSTSRMPMHDEAGAVAGILATYVDVTKSRRTEEALRQSESRFRRAVEAAPTAMLMSDPIGNIIMVNNQAEILFGHERDELLGTSIERLVPMRARDVHGGLRSAFMRNPVTRRMGSNRDVHAIRSDGTEFPVEIGLGLIETDNGPAVLAAITDITLRKQAQAQLEAALREKTVLLNEVHHRVKNNLQVICSLLNLQANASGNRHVRSVLLESHNRVQAMALTHQLLYETKDFSFIDLGEYLQRIASLVTRAMPTSSQHIELITTLERAKAELPCAIACGLIVNELLTNAFKHAFPDDRSGNIWLEFRAADSRPGVLRIADDGVGLPESVRNGVDTSLGLQLVPMLAEQAGATMTVSVDGGTEFVFRFGDESGEQQ